MLIIIILYKRAYFVGLTFTASRLNDPSKYRCTSNPLVLCVFCVEINSGLKKTLYNVHDKDLTSYYNIPTKAEDCFWFS